MEERILNYLKYIEEAVKQVSDDGKFIDGNGKSRDTREKHGSDKRAGSSEAVRILRQELLVQIGFFSHERLVHLIVTVTFALLTMIAVVTFLITEKVVIIALVVMLMVLLVPYIRHYFILENSVQKLYGFYDKLSPDAEWEKFKNNTKDGNK